MRMSGFLKKPPGEEARATALVRLSASRPSKRVHCGVDLVPKATKSRHVEGQNGEKGQKDVCPPVHGWNLHVCVGPQAVEAPNQSFTTLKDAFPYCVDVSFYAMCT